MKNRLLKQTLAVILVTCMLASLSACGKKDVEAMSGDVEVVEETTDLAGEGTAGSEAVTANDNTVSKSVRTADNTANNKQHVSAGTMSGFLNDTRINGIAPVTPTPEPTVVPTAAPTAVPTTAPSVTAVPTEAPVVTAEPTPEPMPDIDAYIARVVELVNIERASAGLAPVTMDATLNAAAAVRAQELSVQFSHTRPNGTYFNTAIIEAGIDTRYLYTGENIAAADTPEMVVTNWMNSEGHRTNILKPQYTRIGVGCYVEPIIWNGINLGYTISWSQLFTS